jgi:hypothetical protein
MQKAFGTANVEAIREMGVGGKEFVLAITEAAKELPRVQGGIKNSIGNALDAIKQSAAKVGEAINSAFDIAGTAESFGNFLVGLADGFSSLNPAVQSFVVYLGAALVAAGPLAKVFGAMTLLSAQLTSVWKGLVSAGSFVVDVFTKVNYAAGAIKWGNVITLVAGLAAAFYGLYQVTRDTDDVSQSFAKSQAEITKQTASEVGALNAAFAILKDETKSRVEKGEVIDKLLAQYPGYLKGIDLENASVKKLTEVQKALNAEILRGVAERQKASAVTAIYEKQAAILLRIQQIRDGASVTAGESLLIDTGDLIRTGSRATAIIEKLQQQQAKLGDDAVRLAGQFDKAFGTFNASADQALAAEYAARDAYYASRDALDNKVVSTIKHTSSIKAQTKALKEQAEVINVTPDIANFDQLPTLPTPTSVTSEGQAGPTPQTVDTSNLQQYLSFAEQLGEVNTKFQESAIGFNTAFSETARLVQEQGTVMQQIMFGVADAVQEAALSGETSFKALAGAAVAAAAKVVRSWIQQGVAAAVAKALGSLPFPANIAAGALAGGLASAAFTKAIRAIGVPKFARGTNFAPGGLSLVGEQGPELMNVPRGAQIASNQRTNRLLNNMGGGGMTVSGELRGRGSELYAVIKSVESKNKRTT